MSLLKSLTVFVVLTVPIVLFSAKATRIWAQAQAKSIGAVALCIRQLPSNQPTLWRSTHRAGYILRGTTLRRRQTSLRKISFGVLP